MSLHTRLIVALFVVLSCSQGPEDYNECILQNVKPRMTDQAVLLVTQACRNEFPERPPAPRAELSNLPPDALSKLTGKLGPSSGNMWRGNVYNGSPTWHVEELTIRLIGVIGQADHLNVFGLNKQNRPPGWELFHEQTKEMGRAGEARTELYLIDESIPPLSNREFSLSMNWDRGHAYDWHIVSARGRKTK